MYNLHTGANNAYFYDDGGFNSSTQVFTAPVSALGITPGRTFGYSVYAFDNYFTGAATDAITDQSFTWGAPRYTAPAQTSVPAAGTAAVPVSTTGSTAGSSESGP